MRKGVEMLSEKNFGKIFLRRWKFAKNRKFCEIWVKITKVKKCFKQMIWEVFCARTVGANKRNFTAVLFKYILVAHGYYYWIMITYQYYWWFIDTKIININWEQNNINILYPLQRSSVWSLIMESAWQLFVFFALEKI